MAKQIPKEKIQAEKISGILAGVSGEYFVAAESSRRGYIPSVTLKNTKGIDILVTNESATRTIGIQVKAKRTIFSYSSMLGRPSPQQFCSKPRLLVNLLAHRHLQF